MLRLVGFLLAGDERIGKTIAAIEKGYMEGGFVRRQEARARLKHVLGVSNDLGLLSEEDHVPSRRLVGNFPQALTHTGVIKSALGLCGPTLQRGGG